MGNEKWQGGELEERGGGLNILGAHDSSHSHVSSYRCVCEAQVQEHDD